MSGIVEQEITVDGCTIKYPWHCEWELPWIESDLVELRKHKERIKDFFLQHLSREKKRLWKLTETEDQDYWTECEDTFLLNAEVQVTDWCELYLFQEDELWFRAGCGLDPGKRGVGINFCASHNEPSW